MKKITILLLSMMMMLSSWVFPVAIKATTQFENATVLTLPFDEDVDNTNGNVVKTSYNDETYGFIYKFISDQDSAIEVQLSASDDYPDLIIELYEKIDGEYQLIKNVDNTILDEYLYTNIDANKEYCILIAGYDKKCVGPFNIKINECERANTIENHINNATSITSLPYEDTFNPLEYPYRDEYDQNRFGKAYQIDLKKDEVMYVSLKDDEYSDYVLQIYQNVDGTLHKVANVDNEDGESLYYLALKDDTYYIIANRLNTFYSVNASLYVKKIDKTVKNAHVLFETIKATTLPYKTNQYDDCLYDSGVNTLHQGVVYALDVKTNKDYTFKFNYDANILTDIYRVDGDGSCYAFDFDILNSFTYHSFADETLYFFSYEYCESETSFSLEIEEVSNGYRSVLSKAQAITLGNHQVKLTKDDLFLESVDNNALGKAYTIDIKEDQAFLFDIKDSKNETAYYTFYSLEDGKYEEYLHYVSYEDNYLVQAVKDTTLYFIVCTDENLTDDHEINLSISELQEQNDIYIDEDSLDFNYEYYAYDKASATLTLKDGFDLKETHLYSYVPHLTIVVEGKASLQTYYDYFLIDGENITIKLKDNAELNLDSLVASISCNDLKIEGLGTNSKINVNSKTSGIGVNSMVCNNTTLNIKASEIGIIVMNMNSSDSEAIKLMNSSVTIKDVSYGINCDDSIRLNNTSLTMSNIIEHGICIGEDIISENSTIAISSDLACILSEGNMISLNNTKLALDSQSETIIRLNEVDEVNVEYTNDDELVILKDIDDQYIGRIDDTINNLTFIDQHAASNYTRITKATSISKDEVSYVDNKNGTHSIKYNDEVLTIEACYDFINDKCIHCNNSIYNTLSFTYCENIPFSDRVKDAIDFYENTSALSNTIPTSEQNYRLFKVYGFEAIHNDEAVEVYNYPISIIDDELINKTLTIILYGENYSDVLERDTTFEDGELAYVYPSLPANIVIQELISDYEYLKLAIQQAENIDVSMASESTASKFNEMLKEAKQVAKNTNASDEEYIEARYNLANAYCDLVYVPFNDIKEKDWFFKVVIQASELGLMGKLKEENGKVLFGPDVNISRGMVATVLYRMAGQPKVEFKATFSDVTNSKLWYSTAITWASEKGVVSGYKDGRFGPDDNITRQDLAIMLRNFAKANGVNTNKQADLSKFIDANKVDSYASSAVAWCVEAGLISGSKTNEGTKLNPKNNATRAECAKMFTLLYPSEE